MHSLILAAALLGSAAHAWLPQQRDLAAFNASRFESQDGTHDKRFKPTLPSGVTKIRGVNFGGKLTNRWRNAIADL